MSKLHAPTANRIGIRLALWPLRKGKSYDNPHPLEVWVTVNKHRKHFLAVWQGETLRVNPSEWRLDQQTTARRNNPVNALIRALKDRLEDIYYEQQRMGKPTLDSVLFEYRHDARPHWSGLEWILPVVKQTKQGLFVASSRSDLRSAYQAYVQHLSERPDAPSPITLGRWQRGLYLLNTYAQATNQPLPDMGSITIGWAKRYHAWLQSQGGGRYQPNPVSEGQASRFVLKLATVVDWLIEEEVLKDNPIRRVRWPKPADKEVQFIQPEQVAHLLTLDWKGTKGICLWWFCLMCCTGLDYPDAVAYARNRAAYEVTGPHGTKLVGRRNKPPHNEFHLPLLPEVNQLFDRFPTGPIDPTSQCVNRYSDHIEQELGISWRITAKTARKSFGALMLAAGLRIAEVSLMLGHASIAVTERHYVKVRGESIDRAMARQQVSLSQIVATGGQSHA